MRYAILILERDGEAHYLRQGADPHAGPIAVYTSKLRAERDAEFWRDGLGDEVQSVNVVKFGQPKPLATR